MINFDEKNNDVLKGYSMLLSVCGSFVLNMPQENCIRDVAESNMFRKMPVRSSNPDFTLAVSFLNNINSDKPIDYNLIREDHIHLFKGGSAKATPFESYYSGLTNPGNIRQALSITYESYAWRPDPNSSISHDHLGIELQFLILLIEKLHGLDDGACRVELTGDIRKFIDNHLKTWIEKWNLDLQQNAGSDFYKGLGYLTTASVEDISQLIA